MACDGYEAPLASMDDGSEKAQPDEEKEEAVEETFHGDSKLFHGDSKLFEGIQTVQVMKIDVDVLLTPRIDDLFSKAHSCQKIRIYA